MSSVIVCLVLICKVLWAGPVAFEFPVNQIINSNYHTNLRIALGKTGQLYCLSGQQEKPNNPSALGKLYLLLTRPQDNQPAFSIDIQTIYRPSKFLVGKTFTIDGVSYELKYVPRDFRHDPYVGDLYIIAHADGFNSYTIGIEEILRALYERAFPIQGVPYKLGMFSKHDKPDEYWVLVMKQVPENRYRDFDGFYVDADAIPVNSDGEVPLKVFTQHFGNYTFSFAFIHRPRGTVLYLQVTQ